MKKHAIINVFSKTLAILLGFLFTSSAIADDYVVILLDTSGSMAERMTRVPLSKMKAAQEALCNVVQKMPATTQLGLLTFNGWVFRLEPINEANTQAMIRGTSPSGGTPLGGFMKAAADELLRTREKNHGVGTYTLLVVTDGESTDTNLMIANTNDINSRGLTLKTIGLNLDKAHTLAQRSVAYFAADDPHSLEKALQKAVAEVPAGNDEIGEDAYAMIASIPTDMAPQLISAITDTIALNQPIGEKPRVKVIDARGNVTYVTPAIEDSGDSGWTIVGMIVVVLFVLSVVLWVAVVIISIFNRDST